MKVTFTKGSRTEGIDFSSCQYSVWYRVVETFMEYPVNSLMRRVSDSIVVIRPNGIDILRGINASYNIEKCRFTQVQAGDQVNIVF